MAEPKALSLSPSAVQGIKSPFESSKQNVKIEENSPENVRVSDFYNANSEANFIFDFSIRSMNYDPNSTPELTQDNSGNIPFSVDSTGIKTNGKVLDYETKPYWIIQVEAKNKQTNEKYTQFVLVELIDVNEAPTDIKINDEKNNAVPSLNINEENVDSDRSLKLETSDPDSGESFSYKVSDPKDIFYVENGSLKIHQEKVNFAQYEDYEIEIQSTDKGGLSVTKKIKVKISESQTAKQIDESISGLQSDIRYQQNELAGRNLLDPFRGLGAEDRIAKYKEQIALLKQTKEDLLSKKINSTKARTINTKLESVASTEKNKLVEYARPNNNAVKPGKLSSTIYKVTIGNNKNIDVTIPDTISNDSTQILSQIQLSTSLLPKHLQDSIASEILINPGDGDGTTGAAHTNGMALNFFSGTKYLNSGIFLHESAHNIQHNKYDENKLSGEWLNAIQDDNYTPLTNYGDTIDANGKSTFKNPVENFADFFALYVMSKHINEGNLPKRVEREFIKDLESRYLFEKIGLGQVDAKGNRSLSIDPKKLFEKLKDVYPNRFKITEAIWNNTYQGATKEEKQASGFKWPFG